MPVSGGMASELSGKAMVIRTTSVFRLIILLATAQGVVTPGALAQERSTPMKQIAKGTFTVDMRPAGPGPAEGLARFSAEKQIHGDLEATSKGEMLSGGDAKQGAAGYVAIELVTGKLNGKSGSFALQQMGSMDENGKRLSVIVVPGSGAGELKGITGTFEIKIEGGKHFYSLEYSLPK